MTTCGSWPYSLMQLAADQQVEELVGAAELDVRLERDRVVALQQRVEELVQRDGWLALKRLAKSSRSSMRATVYLAASSTMPAGSSVSQPLGVVADLGVGAVEHLEDLRLVGLRVGLISSRVSRGRVTLRPVGSPIMAGEVADQEDDGVPEVLELTHLLDAARCARGAGRARSDRSPP